MSDRDSTEKTRILEGHLTVSAVMAEKPVTVRTGTPLARVTELLSDSRYRHVLVSDEQGRLVGVVSSNDMLRYLSSSLRGEREDYRFKCVEAVMTTKFLASTPDADADTVAPMLVSGSIQCMPVVEDEKLVGVLTSDDLLLSWNRINPLLQEAAQDAVTELASRGVFDRRLEEEWERSRRHATPLSLLIVDLDCFKEINDSCGHRTGDAVLQMVGSCLRRHLRGYDVVARFGGDEFAALCVNCDPDSVPVPIQRLQQAVRNLSVPAETGRKSITLSIGVAVMRDQLADYTAADLVAAADGCLYEAKRAGRDCAFATERLRHRDGQRSHRAASDRRDGSAGTLKR